jgi:pyruvate kinase
MKKKMMGILAVTALMMAFTPTSPAFERHPEIRAALDALHNAKEHLQHASHDFHGHRVDAIRAIDEADRQLRICMEVD